MKAISIAPATAACITTQGQNILNRTYDCPHNLLGKELVIHTSTGFSEDIEAIYQAYGCQVEPLPPGCIVAIVRVIGCPRRTDSIWAKPGLFHWEIQLEAVLEKPLFYKGGSGIWSLDKDIHKHIYQQIGRKIQKRKALKDLVSVSA